VWIAGSQVGKLFEVNPPFRGEKKISQSEIAGIAPKIEMAHLVYYVRIAGFRTQSRHLLFNCPHILQCVC
jgi:hypothetical protein